MVNTKITIMKHGTELRMMNLRQPWSIMIIMAAAMKAEVGENSKL